MLNIVLVEPEIPQNTGNIARTCVVTGAKLHLVGPLGFSIDDRSLKRAGMDYWQDLDWQYYSSLQEFMESYPEGRSWYLSTKGKKNYTDASFTETDFLVFGKETAGLPKDLLASNEERVIRIPMKPDTRSLNLSNSVAIVLYEALRQVGFKSLF